MTGSDERGVECLSFTVANVALLPTVNGPGRGGAGLNEIYVWLLLAPANEPNAPGFARAALVPVRLEGDRRSPPDAVIVIESGDLASLR